MADNIIDEREEAMISPCGGKSFIRIAHFLKPTEVFPILKMADNIIDEREEAMISPCGGKSFIRIAHFLKPTETLSKPKIFDVRKTPLHVCFKSSTTPLEGWSNWVNLLLPKYKVIWKQAGIYDSILASTGKINMHQNLVLALAKTTFASNCEDKPAFIPFVDDDDNLKTMEVIKKAKVDGTDGSSSNTEKELKNNRELELEARVCELEARVHELEGLIKETTERLGLIEELSSCRRSVGCSCMI